MCDLKMDSSFTKLDPPKNARFCQRNLKCMFDEWFNRFLDFVQNHPLKSINVSRFVVKIATLNEQIHISPQKSPIFEI